MLNGKKSNVVMMNIAYKINKLKYQLDLNFKFK